MTQLFRWINSPPGQHCLAVIHIQYHSMCITLALYTSCITMWFTHFTPCIIVHLSVMEDPSPFLNTLESIRNSSPANAIRRLHHSRQSLVEGVFKISSQASGAAWEVVSARSSNSGSNIISSRSTILIPFILQLTSTFANPDTDYLKYSFSV